MKINTSFNSEKLRILVSLHMSRLFLLSKEEQKFNFKYSVTFGTDRCLHLCGGTVRKLEMGRIQA